MRISFEHAKRVSGISLQIALGVFLLAILFNSWKAPETQASSAKSYSKVKMSHRAASLEALLPGQGATCTINGVLSQGSPDHPSTTGQQTGRILQNGVDSTCASPKTCPGVTDTGTMFTFDAYQFQNTDSAPACVSVTLPPSCGANQAIHPVAYLGSFNPSSVCTNYLADFGQSVNLGAGGAFSFTVPAGAVFTLVLHEVGTLPGCSSYSFTTSGLVDCNQPLLCSSPTTLTGSITMSDPTQTGRLVRDDPGSTCATSQTCSPQDSTPRHYDSYTFTNATGPTTCVTVTVNAMTCINAQFLHAVAYLNSFDPSNVCTNYLADIGGSPNPTKSFSFNVPAGASFVLVINEVDPGAGCASYSATVACCSITCPANITQNNDPGLCGAVVAFPAPTADAVLCGTVTCSPSSGSFFPVGTTTVTCTTTAGPSCTFTVTVNDTQPPTITCPAPVTAVAAQTCPLSTSTSVTFPAPTFSDNCPGATVACVPPSGSPFPAGTTTVTCTATDTSGNTASCSFTVSVFSACLQDDSNPTNVVLFNLSGEYRFCCNGMIFSGTGIATVRGCVVSIQHNPVDRRVLLTFDGAVHRGTASLQSPPGTIKCTIIDRNTTNNTCACQ
jgi:HYR domain